MSYRLTFQTTLPNPPRCPVCGEPLTGPSTRFVDGLAVCALCENPHTQKIAPHLHWAFEILTHRGWIATGCGFDFYCPPPSAGPVSTAITEAARLLKILVHPRNAPLAAGTFAPNGHDPEDS